jgi:hydrogenase nickel incorporation protein HypA/HybF
MHEWALAEAVVSTVVREAEKEKLKEVMRVKVRVGELGQIEVDAFEFVLKTIFQSHSLSPEVEIGVEKGALECNVCGQEWEYGNGDKDKEEWELIHFLPEVAHAYMKCPRCGSRDFKIVRGRGVVIESIEGR